jgi:hypothetical protein
MQRSGTRAALDLYDELAGPDARGATSTDEHSLVLVHALLRPQPGPALQLWERHISSHPLVLDAADQQRAACGLRMKVVLPYPFDDEDADACPGCRREAARWALNPERWWLEQRRWEQRKRDDGDTAENVALWRALEDRRRSWIERSAQAGGSDEPRPIG